MERDSFDFDSRYADEIVSLTFETVNRRARFEGGNEEESARKGKRYSRAKVAREARRIREGKLLAEGECER